MRQQAQRSSWIELLVRLKRWLLSADRRGHVLGKGEGTLDTSSTANLRGEKR